ncbi:NAD+ synthase [Rickettsiales bacterium]|nr:NAD+ synthase [Rickettsiales bacterium]
MTESIKISLAQLNFIMGDLEGNRDKIIAAQKQSHAEGADLVVFSELAIIGYPAEDLVLRNKLQDESIQILRDLAIHTKNSTAMLVGTLWKEGNKLYNAAAMLEDGEIKHITCKHNLPNYGVFDEVRIFEQAPLPEPILFKGINLGVMICEDLWQLEVGKHLAKHHSDIFIALNASPFEVKKGSKRLEISRKNAIESDTPLIYVNQIGGQDELVFSGASFILSNDGTLQVQMPKWEESLQTTSWIKKDASWVCEDSLSSFTPDDEYETIYSASKLGLRDYVEKNGFPGVIIGFSGGIDSALTAAIAVDSLGKERVKIVMMPSKYTSKESLNDAKECADLLGLKLEEISIVPAVEAFEKMLEPFFKETETGLAEENLQSRIRGNILMALSNKFGDMVLTTGNKSEMAVGYATLYGDMCGGYNVLKDLYKVDVFKLAKWRNESEGVIIPKNIITKPPTAELRPNQKDADSLPPYEVLDDILYRLIELKHSSEQIAEHGHPIEIVKHISNLVRKTEYKRFQAPPGVKITQLAFGKDRRYPITNKFSF